jgi:hypothetical protein
MMVGGNKGTIRCSQGWRLPWAYPCNRVDYTPLLHATLLRLDQWVTAREAPSSTQHPRLPDGFCQQACRTTRSQAYHGG